MEDVKVEKFRMKDGRYGETKVRELTDPSEAGSSETVYEHFEEEPRLMHLRKRVVEKKKPVVYERVVESIDDEQVVERKVESCDPTVNMQLREHIALASPPVEQRPDPCYATVEDLKQAMLTVAEAVKSSTPRVRMLAIDEPTNVWKWVEILILGVIGVEAAWIAIHIIPQIVSRYTGS
jgi:hypothetical protein